ncbi:MAG: 16S rRNA (adenine(1518)-N(6)/adenine(1519)-N(6))-dimethyltransferase RsmA [Candidatus Hodarchaeales archaeon]
MNLLHLLKNGDINGYTKALIRNYAIKMNKNHGQNFVVDKNLLNYLISIADLTTEDIVVEVGGGIGTVTFDLLKNCKKVYLYEIDPILSSIIVKVFNKYQDNLEVISGDFLTEAIPKHHKLVSNLPYNISSPFMKKITKMEYRPNIISVTFQKEFADHLCAKPGDSEYSRISVHSSFFYKLEIIETFSPSSFYPTPKVHSSLVRGCKLNPPDSVKEKDFSEFLTNLFCRKHKKVRNNLRVYSKALAREQRKDLMREIDKLEFKANQPVNLTPNEILSLFLEFKSILKNF